MRYKTSAHARFNPMITSSLWSDYMQDNHDFKSYAFKWGNFLILTRITLITLRVAAHFLKTTGTT